MKIEIEGAEPRRRGPVPPTVAASMVLGEASSTSDDGQATGEDNKTSLEECIICLERRPDVILPCAHAYCLPCIEQWWEYCTPALEECASSLYVQST